MKQKSLEPKSGIAGFIGLAVVRKSLNPGWPRWACIYPNKPTQWFKTEVEAQQAANKYNN